MDAALLLLVDGRFPAGGHAYSGGVEAAVALGDVHDVASLERYAAGRMATTGVVDAAFAAHACRRALDVDDHGFVEDFVRALDVLDVEYDARVPSPYLRSTSRRLGRQLLRAASRIWTHPVLDAVGSVGGGPHQPVVLGTCVAAVGGSPEDAAALVFHHLGAAVTTAAVRLLGLDPIELAAVQARLGRVADVRAPDAGRWSRTAPYDLPATGGTLTEILGERHGGLDARYFVA